MNRSVIVARIQPGEEKSVARIFAVGYALLLVGAWALHGPAAPAPVGAAPGVPGASAIAASRFHSLALKSDVTVWAWGKNVTNTYYWTSVFAIGDAVSRFVGQPATYGVSFSARF